MADQTHNPPWLYYKIYVGDVAAGLEYLITQTVPTVVTHTDVEQWFFLRYIDEAGPHLRLRLKARRSTSDLRTALLLSIDQALAILPRLPFPFYRPVILQPMIPKTVGDGVIRAVETKYEPEVDKFGKRGIAVAERLFQLSSELAVAVLIADQARLYSRKTLIPVFMEVVRETFAPSSGPLFWADYSKYWLEISGCSPCDWQPRFEAKARELKANRVPVLASKADLPQKSVHFVEAWRKGLADAVAEFTELGETSAKALAWNFAHLMNNRLGLMPIEEAYFSALLQDALASSRP